MSDIDRSANWEWAVLQYNPFADDKDDGGYWILEDKIVTARKSATCAECLGIVEPGTKVRLMTAVGDGRIHHARSCQDCCDAMAEWTRGYPEPMTARYAKMSEVRHGAA